MPTEKVSFSEILSLLPHVSQCENIFLGPVLVFSFFFLWLAFFFMSNTNTIILKKKIIEIGLNQWGKSYIVPGQGYQ